MGLFRDTVDEYLSEVISAAPLLLSEEVKEDLEKPFREAFSLIAGDTLEEMAAAIIAADNPIVAFDRNLSTNRQKQEAYQRLKSQLESGEKKLPEELYHVIRCRFRLLADALSEMLTNIRCHKKEISDLLFGGEEYTSIERITAGAGDYHNYARAIAIIWTDRGKMLYKPRNCITDVRTRMFVQKYFPDSVVVPKCYTDGISFGVCEYLHSDRANGKSQAKTWFHALGELTVLIQIMGSCDMHYENIMASEGLPALIDLETILYPLLSSDGKQASDGHEVPSFMGELTYSIWYSAVLPRDQNGKQLSVLLNTDEENQSVPVEDGKPVTVLDYMDQYFSGFDTAYRRCLAEKETLLKDVRDLFSEVPVRLMIRSTQIYADLMKRLYKARVLSSEEAHTSFAVQMEKALMNGLGEDKYRGICRSERDAVLRGDIPYFYTSGNESEVFDADGRIGDLIRESGISESLKRISRMSEQELLFENKLILEALQTVPVKNGQDDENLSGAKGRVIPERSAEALSPERAVQEAGGILKMICGRMIPTPGGCFGWVDLSGRDGSPEIMPGGMFTGTAGIGLFAAAAAAVFPSGDILEAAEKCEETVIADLMRFIGQMKELKRAAASGMLSLNVGDGSGLAGFLRCLALMNRYSGCDRFAGMIDEGLKLLEYIDISGIADADRISGLAGIIAVLCSFPEFNRKQQVTALIASFADRLLELRTFEADGCRLWKTVSSRHIISGAGHGMAGIAEALFAAGRLLSDRKYLDAVLDALRYETEVYSEKLGTWPDNRVWPAQGYMHGYCSGAPGIGIMMRRIQSGLPVSTEPDFVCAGIEESCRRCAALAEAANDRLPLLFRDHLCCGNSAIVEYYLSLGKIEEAGRVLNAMYQRKEKAGTYMTLPDGVRSIKPVTSLFFGIAGIGYEMLRYAFPDKILPLV